MREIGRGCHGRREPCERVNGLRVQTEPLRYGRRWRRCPLAGRQRTYEAILRGIDVIALHEVVHDYFQAASTAQTGSLSVFAIWLLICSADSVATFWAKAAKSLA